MRRKGFTLVELMIVVAIAGILAAIAYPNYIDSIRKSRRSLAKTALMDAAQKQEAFYARNASYTGNLADLGYNASPHVIKSDSGKIYYDMIIDAPDASCPLTSCYRFTARALNDQLHDDFTQYRIWSTGRKQKYDGAAWSEGWPD
jgi:type IV pilus assembly protein PilE